MNDYKELIAELKELSDEEKEFASNSGDIYCAEKLALAADAVEQLVKAYDEIDKAHHDLFMEYCKVKKEHDAEPVRHGHWVLRIHDEDDDGGYPLYHCSMCDNPRPHKRDNYCPNCGAKMDEVSE